MDKRDRGSVKSNAVLKLERLPGTFPTRRSLTYCA
jgi:hypothetical protein